MINKLMWEIDRYDESVEAYRRDPAVFLDDWEARASTALPPYPEGGTLTPDERQAFEQRDFAKLFALGGHPYLLWHLVRAVSEETTLEELNDTFKRSVADLGRPDFAT